MSRSAEALQASSLNAEIVCWRETDERREPGGVMKIRARVPSSLVVRLAEFRPKEEVLLVPRRRRGLYVLFNRKPDSRKYDVVYVGLSCVTIRGRLRAHRGSRRKGPQWTHFSIFEVSPSVTDTQIAELEGLFRHIYRRDSRANTLNRQRTHAALRRIRNNDLASW